MDKEALENVLKDIVVDSEGYAECPVCQTRVRCGTVGLSNLTKRHLGSKACQKEKEKKAKDQKKSKTGSILDIFKRAALPKATPVPSTVPKSTIIQGSAPKGPTSLTDKGTSIQTIPTLQSQSILSPKNLKISDFLGRLQALIENLPRTIPEATIYDPLAVFEGPPSKFDDASLESEELWEKVVNRQLKSVLGWGTEGDMKKLIRRGRLGVDGLLNYVKYFVVKRGVSEGLFEGKLSYLMKAMEDLTNEDVQPRSGTSGLRAFQTVKEQTNTNLRKQHQIFDVDSFEFEDTLQKSNMGSAPRCRGYVLIFPDGKSPHTTYPFALHETLALPWNYSVENGVMTLRARNCTLTTENHTGSCSPCQRLAQNLTLEGIITRIEDGTHPNTNYAYHGFNGLHDILRRKNRQIEFYRFRSLNLAKSLLGKAAALTDQKRLLMAIASGDVHRVDRLISIGLQQKKSVRALLAAVMAAAQGHYSPKSFTEEEDMRAILLWRLGGNRVAEILHRSQGAPSITYLRSRSTVPPIIPSHAQPTVEEVSKNVEATLQSVLDLVHGQAEGRVVHTVVMFDELATEKRIRWDPKTDLLLGVCRQHADQTDLQFINEKVLEELFVKIDEGRLHYAAEATIGALGILCKDNRIYPGRPVLISGDCKRETGGQHARVIQTVLDGINLHQEQTKLRVVSLASDGEARRGSAFIELTFKKILTSDSPLFHLLKPIKFLNLYVGDDDLTCDKDWKHIFKRFRNLLLRPRGVVIGGFRITPDITKDHFKSFGHSADHVRSLFNPDDQQDVKMAFDMLKDIWTLPRTTSHTRPGFLAAQEALWTLGKLLYHMVFPYLCVDLSLSEQIEHLSAAAHLALALYKLAGKDFIPTNLYIDLMIMVKNVLFCVAKAKVDNPSGELWIILLGTDRLEELFGILRTMVGNDANSDILQLVYRLSGTTEVSNILAKYPHWDRTPRRLKLPTMSRESKEIPNDADHIKPSSWRGNVRLADVSIQTSWSRGRRLAEEECDFVKPLLEALETAPGVDILAPSGVLLVDAPIDEDDVDESLEILSAVAASIAIEAASESTNGETRVEVEDELADLASTDDIALQNDKAASVIERTLLVEGKPMPKSKLLARYSKYRKHTSSTDRLRRVQQVERFTNNKSTSSPSQQNILPPDETDVLVISDPIASLISSEGMAWLCIGEVNGLKIDGKSMQFISMDIILERTVTVSYQLLGLRPATSNDDPDLQHDWRTYRMNREHSFTVPGRLIQPINPTISKVQSRFPFYILKSSVLVALAASLFQSLGGIYKDIPKLSPTNEFPYREASGGACFVCQNEKQLADPGMSDCPRCSPTVRLDLSQGQRVLEHIGAHLRHDDGLGKSVELCGLCLRPPSFCQFYLRKGTGASKSPQINQTLSKGCLIKLKFSYSVAAKSKTSSPCSNVPIHCPLCPKNEPAVWKYCMEAHFNEKHKPSMQKYAYLWEISALEKLAMAKIWASRATGVVKRPVKTTLVISEDHRACIPGSADDSESSDSGSELDVREMAHGSETDESDLGEIEMEESPVRVTQKRCVEVAEVDVHRAPALGEMVVDEQGEVGGGLAHDVSPVRISEALVDSGSQSGSSALQLPPETTATGRPKRQRVQREVVLNGCTGCQEIVNPMTDVAVECKAPGCETQWYHLSCLDIEFVPRNWVCDACKASGMARGNKRVRK